MPSNTQITESIVEDAALTCLELLGYAVFHGPDITVGNSAAERRVEEEL